jgi:hypothetical protein
MSWGSAYFITTPDYNLRQAYPEAEGFRVCRAGLADGGAQNRDDTRLPQEDGYIMPTGVEFDLRA